MEWQILAIFALTIASTSFIAFDNRQNRARKQQPARIVAHRRGSRAMHNRADDKLL